MVAATTLLAHRDRTADTGARQQVAAPAEVDNRFPSAADLAGTAVPTAGPWPAAAGTSTVVHDVLAAATDALLDPSPRASYPAPLASPAMCTSRIRGRSTCPALVPRAPENYTIQVHVPTVTKGGHGFTVSRTLTRPTRLSALPITSKFGFRSAGLPGRLWDRRSAPMLPLLSPAQETDERGEPSRN